MFKLKGTGPLTFLLGCNCYRNEDGLFYAKPQKSMLRKWNPLTSALWWEAITQGHFTTWKKRPSWNWWLNTLLGKNEITIYQSMNGASHPIASIGHFDIVVHGTSLSSFCAQRAALAWTYLTKSSTLNIKNKHSAIRICTELSTQSFGLQHPLVWLVAFTIVCGRKRKELPDNLPPTRGKPLPNLCWHQSLPTSSFVLTPISTMMFFLASLLPVVSTSLTHWFSKLQEVKHHWDCQLPPFDPR